LSLLKCSDLCVLCEWTVSRTGDRADQSTVARGSDDMPQSQYVNVRLAEVHCSLDISSH
jgi:hypothetical protein